MTDFDLGKILREISEKHDLVFNHGQIVSFDLGLLHTGSYKSFEVECLTKEDRRIGIRTDFYKNQPSKSEISLYKYDRKNEDIRFIISYPIQAVEDSETGIRLMAEIRSSIDEGNSFINTIDKYRIRG